MAREKKKETLTPEERLQAALVPDWEQPYKVPENWCWVKLGTVCKFENGYAFKSKYFSANEGIPVIRISNIVDNSISLEECVNTIEKNIDEKYIIKNGDLLIAMSGATTGKNGIYYSDKIAYLNQRVGNIKVIDENLLTSRFRNFYIANVEQEILNSAYGGAQPNISSNKICNMNFPLPPLSEQQRIVDCIESLFTKLDKAKQKAQDALDSFETCKAAILHKAFTGELTSHWRKEHGVGMESWTKKRFDEVATIKSNLVDPAIFPDLPHIAPDNIEKKTGVLLEYHTVSEDGVTSGKHRFYPGQILYSKIRPYLSKVIIVDFDGLCSADMYPIEAKGNTKCLWYYMLSEEFLEQASTAGSRSVLPKINRKELSALTVVLPTASEEQTEIARILDDLLDKEQKAKEAAEAVLEQIDLIKKSILARAFRGELGTNDPVEESAVELVKEVVEKSAEINNKPKTKTKRTVIPGKIKYALSNSNEEEIVRLLIKSVPKAVSLQMIMSISKKKFELMDALRSLEQKQIVIKNSLGEYLLKR